MKYRLSREAVKDLENIWVYTLKKWSRNHADRYYKLIIAEIKYVAENLYSGKDYGEVRDGYFRMRVKAHFIFYRVNTDAVEIIRILHQSMDIERRLSE